MNGPYRTITATDVDRVIGPVSVRDDLRLARKFLALRLAEWRHAWDYEPDPALRQHRREVAAAASARVRVLEMLRDNPRLRDSASGREFAERTFFQAEYDYVDFGPSPMERR